MENFTETDIKAALRECLRLNPDIKATDSLVVTVYTVLKELYENDRQYVILEAPTGSGKTIIGFMVHFCTAWLINNSVGNDKIYQRKLEDPLKDKMCLAPADGNVSYFLTSSKMLQEQIDTDLDRFDFREYITMLKGTANYLCTKLTEESKSDVFYPDRYCLGMKSEEIGMLGCYDTCPYKMKRAEAAEANCTVLNYSYFLNVMRSEFKPFFGTRTLTIADEAHLIPEIVLNQFNYEFTQYILNRIRKLYDNIRMSYGNAVKGLSDLENLLPEAFSFFNNQLNDTSFAIEYLKTLDAIYKALTTIKSENTKLDDFVEVFGKSISSVLEDIDGILASGEDLSNLIQDRPKDIFVGSTEVAFDKVTGARIFKHVIKDLSEADMVRKNFLSKVDKCLMMSATLGDIDEFASLMGLEKGEYAGWRLPSTFDFSKSPINLCKSGWLNYNNFKNNIDKVVMDCIKICNDLHPNDKGIIHTSTFNIADKIQEAIYRGLAKDSSRFLFYRNSEEKEKLVQLMKESPEPFILVGPSLYEGLDLKYEQGRFNILVKVPYAGLDDYLRKKIERFPFWYERNTLEKIVQAIGRTNRAVDDWSVIYLLDSGFEKLIIKAGQYIVDRVRYKTIR